MSSVVCEVTDESLHVNKRVRRLTNQQWLELVGTECVARVGTWVGQTSVVKVVLPRQGFTEP